jgi:ribonuclease Z
MLTMNIDPIRAVSVGGMETCIEVPSWKLCFDIGRCPPSAHRWSRVLFTHAHSDHMGGVISHCASRDLLGMSRPTYLMPAENREDFLSMLEAWRRLDRSDLPCEVHGVSPGDQFDLGNGRIAHVFRAVHRVPSVGYALEGIRRRLKAEYRNLPGAELARLRGQGVTIDERSQLLDVAFCGDTTIDVVDREALVRTARCLVLEVTFLGPEVSPEAARRKGHVHLDDVVERADLFENEKIILTHFSTRYSTSFILREIDRRVPPGLRPRIFPLLREAPWATGGDAIAS